MSPRKAARVYVNILEAAFQAQIVKLATLARLEGLPHARQPPIARGIPGPDPDSEGRA